MNDTPRYSGITPNCAAHELHVGTGTMNSPAEPCVELWATEGGGDVCLAGAGYADEHDRLTPYQAREYARRLLAAADDAEGIVSALPELLTAGGVPVDVLRSYSGAPLGLGRA